MTRGPNGGADLPSLRGDHDLTWMDDAACRTPMPGFTRAEWVHVFFPERGETHLVTLAKSVCSLCPVAEECGRFALETNQRGGTWGGTSGRDRRRIKGEDSGIALDPADEPDDDDELGYIGKSTHGTVAGYQAHRYYKSKRCAACQKAWNDHYAAKRAAAREMKAAS